jgi:hypothetical protein
VLFAPLSVNPVLVGLVIIAAVAVPLICVAVQA